jgi:F-type H+-transporting ATPase subunit b
MEALGIDPALLIWQAAAFGLLCYLLYRFAYKPVMNMLDQRTERIRESIAQAEQIKQELAAAQKRGEEEMQRARVESQELVRNAQAASQRTIAAAQEEAQRQREKMLEEARSQIVNETEKAKSDLRREVGRLTVLAATRVIGQELQTNPQLHERLVDEALTQVDRQA